MRSERRLLPYRHRNFVAYPRGTGRKLLTGKVVLVAFEGDQDLSPCHHQDPRSLRNRVSRSIAVVCTLIRDTCVTHRPKQGLAGKLMD